MCANSKENSENISYLKTLKGKEIGNVYIVCFLLQLFLQQKYGIKATTYETIFLKEIVYIQCQFALQIFFFLSKILIFIQAHIGHIYGHLN